MAAPAAPVNRRGAAPRDRLYVLLQSLLPQRTLSALAGRLAASRVRWWKALLIRAVVSLYRVDLAEAAVDDRRGYRSFNDFFTRALAPGARPLAAAPAAVACPVDGTLSHAGEVAAGRLFQAKGHDCSLVELLGGDTARAEPFQGGSFATLYLSPRDYHRVHMARGGRLAEMVRVPGRLFSVDAATTRALPGLFARNERVVSVFETGAGGASTSHPMALVMVGALLVAGIETVWHGPVTPPRGGGVETWRYPAAGDGAVVLERGAEMGRFNFGSTVFVLFGPGRVRWSDSLRPGARVHMGAAIGELVAQG